MSRLPSAVFLALLAICAFVVTTRLRRHGTTRRTPGGSLMPDARAYDRHSRILFGSLYRSIGADIAASAPPGARILEVGCGPGHLSILLAHDHDLNVTGLDLDPAMIHRANANAEASREGDGRQATFIVGDVGALPFEDASFDLVVSTFSMHHWADPTAGLREIARVIRPDGRALIWDLKAGVRLFHVHAPDPAEQVQGSPLRIVSDEPWNWPWRFTLSQRLELARD
jgi:SAM-dependent methyltransferase